MPFSINSLVTVTLFCYRGWHKAWAFYQMGRMPPKLNQVSGLNFFRLLGSGHGNGFSARPEFGVYALLAVWDSTPAAEDFFQDSSIFRAYQAHSDKQFTSFLQPLQAKGTWDQVTPFMCTNTPASTTEPVAILTRATLRWQKLLSFWHYTPRVSAQLTKQPGLILAIGIGELPWIRQATFSIWENTQAMQQFAYLNPLHQQVMQRTRQEQWYKEELFARFRVLGQRGDW